MGSCSILCAAYLQFSSTASRVSTSSNSEAPSAPPRRNGWKPQRGGRRDLHLPNRGGRGGMVQNCRDRVLERVQQARYARTIPTLHPTFNVFSLGVLYKYAQLIRDMLKSPSRLDTGLQDAECHSDSDIEYPLTPPPSDHTISRPLSRSESRGHPNPIISMSVEGYRPSGERVKRRLQCMCWIFDIMLNSYVVVSLNSTARIVSFKIALKRRVETINGPCGTDACS